MPTKFKQCLFNLEQNMRVRYGVCFSL